MLRTYRKAKRVHSNGAQAAAQHEKSLAMKAWPSIKCVRMRVGPRGKVSFETSRCAAHANARCRHFAGTGSTTSRRAPWRQRHRHVISLGVKSRFSRVVLGCARVADHVQWIHVQTTGWDYMCRSSCRLRVAFALDYRDWPVGKVEFSFQRRRSDSSTQHKPYTVRLVSFFFLPLFTHWRPSAAFMAGSILRNTAGRSRGNIVT